MKTSFFPSFFRIWLQIYKRYFLLSSLQQEAAQSRHLGSHREYIYDYRTSQFIVTVEHENLDIPIREEWSLFCSAYYSSPKRDVYMNTILVREIPRILSHYAGKIFATSILVQQCVPVGLQYHQKYQRSNPAALFQRVPVILLMENHHYISCFFGSISVTKKILTNFLDFQVLMICF